MPLLVILSIEVHLAEWNGDRFSKNQIRKKKIVPDPKNIENRDGGQDRFDKRQNDQHKALQNAAAVKQRSLFQFSRDGGYKAPDQKKSESDTAARNKSGSIPIYAQSHADPAL